MQLQELKQQVWDRIDDAPVDLTVIRWMDSAQRRMASAVGAKFPSFVSNNSFDSTLEPLIPEKWQEALIVFACARYKEGEASLNEVANFDAQFQEIAKEFTENYEVPIRYRDDRVSQQFTATANQTQFIITKIGFDPVYGNLQVFINGAKTSNFQIDSNIDPSVQSFTLTVAQPALTGGETITALWEEQYAIQEAPTPWLGAW
jgi:hypothetical protein